MDLSKIPHLELRQKVKPLNDQIDALDEKIAALKTEYRNKLNEAAAPLYVERDRLNDQLEALIGDASLGDIIATCTKTGLPIFEEDETETTHHLSYA